MQQEIQLTREVTAIQIPSGDSVVLPVGTPVYITQRLGGTFTVATSQGLARISSTDADALGVDADEEKRKQEQAVRIKDAPLEDQIWHQLKQVYDPEIPVNILELGLIYEINVLEGNDIIVKMTLTSPACPVAETLPVDVEQKIKEIPDVNNAKVEITFDPPWEKDMMSEEANMELGMW